MAVTTTYSVQLLGTTETLSVNGTTGGYSTNPDTFAFEGGDYYTAIDDASTSLYGHEQITVRGFDSRGVKPSTDQFDGTDPSIARLSNDTFGLVGTDPSGNVVLWTRGTGDAFILTRTTLGKGSNADIASSPNLYSSAYAVVWEAPLDNGYSNISILVANGSKTTSFFVKFGQFRDHNPSVACLGNGNVVVAWDRTDASGATSIWYKVFDGQGYTVTEATQYDAAGRSNRAPSVAASGSGFSIAYEDSETGESQIALFDRSGDGRNVSYTRTGLSGGPDDEASSTNLGGTYATTFTHGFLDGDDVRERGVYLTLHDPETGAVLGDPANPFLIAYNASSSSIAAVPGYDGRFVVSYYEESAGYVYQQVANAVMTITGDAAGQYLSGRPGLAVAIDGGGGNDSLASSDGDDRLLGNTGDDVISVRRGDDFIDGGVGTDTLSIGGYGPVVIDLSKTGPQDTGVGLKTIRGIENITGVSSSSETMIGNDAANVFDSGGIPAGNQPGLDTMIGNGGNDTYIVNRSDTIVRETSASGGTDLVISHVDFVLPDNVENLTLQGYYEVPPLAGTGNGLANVLTGNANNNVLDGKGGADRMAGLAGSDTYRVDNGGDRVIEASGQGADVVYASVSYTLAAEQEIEALEAASAAGTTAYALTGNEYRQTIKGNAGANVLDGRSGADLLVGRAGHDTYFVDNAGDRVIEASGQGSDIVYASVSYMLAAGQEIEALEAASAAGTTAYALTGNEYRQTIKGNAGANVLDGRGGADLLVGRTGHDTYFVDNAGDQVIEASGQGSDIVYASASYTLVAGQEVEALEAATAAGTTAYVFNGNEFGQNVKGNAGANVLDGKGGADTLYGRAGADTFVFSTALGSGNVDRIGDFSHADDTIRLAKSVFAALSAGKLAAGAFKDVAAGKVDADDRVLYNHDTGALSYDADGSGAKAAVQFATLLNKPGNLAFDDFLIV